ncbi:uncharacterized protein (DUF885 family) [Rhizomicrobium palustre]|uniref:Uncharacterized protein (DUF885 family) n=1 Tax=Rhizomicrobium palustre TaxID=189966 RepID=A0A846MV04_9PROT|nr:DUF885 family protein [Rhizomicrobium palustre]NIK87183.1 uncharacterized protein (DUF885 family) [Rhizomicrobium palustre]
MKTCFAAAFALATVFPAMHAATADAQLKTLYTSEWGWRIAEFQDDEDNTRPVPAHLPHVDTVSQEKRLARWQETLAALEKISPTELSPKEQVNAQVYRVQLQSMIASEKFRDYEMPANSDSSFWGEFNDRARRPFRTEQDYRNWLSQLSELPRYFGENIANMRAGLKRGFTPPQVTLQGRGDAITKTASAKPEDTAFFEPFKDMPPNIPASEQAALKAKALKLIMGTVQPAYRDLDTFWRNEYLPHTRKTLAAEDLPDGKAYYRAQILNYATVTTPPEEIHRLGLSEVAKLRGEMEKVMKETGFKGSFAEFQRMLRTDPKFYAKTPQELLDRAAWIAKEFDGKANLWFGLLPRGRFAIRPVPDDIAPFYTSGRGGPGVYLVNTYNLPQRPLYNLTALTLHESAPGHAFQMPLAAEDTSLPDFRRHSYISAYGEGWALYSEWLGQEMGMYHTPYDRFGMLGYQIWRAARLVVDTGIHSKGWTREQAIAYFRENTALPEHEIETEIDRYIAWPGQATSYYLGEMAIRAARAKAEKELGPKFNIRAFHDAVLATGSVPLPVLEWQVSKFIAGGGKGPYPELE